MCSWEVHAFFLFQGQILVFLQWMQALSSVAHLERFSHRTVADSLIKTSGPGGLVRIVVYASWKEPTTCTPRSIGLSIVSLLVIGVIPMSPFRGL